MMKINRRLTAAMLCLAMLLATIGTSLAASLPNNTGLTATLTAVDNALSDELMESRLRTGVMLDRQTGDVIPTPDDEIVTAIVILEGEPLFAQGETDLNSTKAMNALDTIRAEQSAALDRISRELFFGEELDVKYTYYAVLNGFCMQVPYGMIPKLNEISGVKHAYTSTRYAVAELTEDQKFDLDANDYMGEPTRGEENASIYKGEGMVIAILDTGIQTNHPLFTGGIDSPRITTESLAAIFANATLHAEELLPSFTATNAFVRDKIPYQFDYADGDANASYNSSDHGVHVAGIAAGNDGVNSQCYPVAPEAQIVAMKIFRDDGYAYSEDMYAAIEDCAILGVDCLNMSLGSDCGFTATNHYEDFDIALENCANAGVGVAVAAGNSESFSTSNEFGKTLAMNPDNSVVSSPGTFLQSLCVASDTGGASASMSYFSSWGAAPDLVLKPEISSYGDNVYSAVGGGSYGTKSGTSMATPHVAGGMATIKQYLMTQFPGQYSQFELQRLVNTLIINTAVPNYISNSLPYSPRLQGAGHMNIANAVSTPAYITVDGSDRPVIDQYDDVEQTGVYDLEFTINNMSAQTLSYQIQVNAITEKASPMTGPDGSTVYGMDETPYRLNPIIDTGLQNNTVTVPANGSVDVSVRLILTRADIEYIRTRYINGGYVEGFIRLVADETAVVNLTVPFLCFYGDWTRPSTIDRGYYTDDLNNEPNWMSQYLNSAYSANGSSSVFLGDNPYHSGVNYIEDRNVISPNSDSRFERLERIEMSLLRNVVNFRYTISEGDEVYYVRDLPYETKTYYYSNGWFGYMIYIGYDSSTTIDPWRGTDANGATLPNDTTVSVRMDATLDYSLHEHNNESDYWEFPLTIDTQAPQVVDLRVSTVNGVNYLYVTVLDNHYVADIAFTNTTYTTTRDSYAIAETQRGTEYTYCYDITGYGEDFGLVVSDYACNRTTYAVNVADNTDDNQPITQSNTVFIEDFEAQQVPPQNWTSYVTAPDYTWGLAYDSINTNTAHVDYAPSGVAQNEWLITPSLDFTQWDTEIRMALDFSTNYYHTTQTHHANFKVLVTDDPDAQPNTSAWEEIYTIWDASEFESWSWIRQNRIMVPYEYQSAENVRFAFVYEGEDGCMFDLDNILLYDTGYVPAPIPGGGTTASNINEALNVEGGTLEFTNHASRPFIVDNTGARAAAKSNIAGQSSSTTYITLDAGALEAGYLISFDWRVSSESNYDVGKFLVNGTENQRRSGDGGWEHFSYTIPTAGNYIFRWEYSKDGSVNSGSDCMWVDEVFLGAPIPVETINLTPASADITVGSYVRLNAEILPANATIQDLLYTSSNNAVAAVDQTGLVTALSIGTATITAANEASGVTAVCQITVNDLPDIPDGYALVALSASDVWNNGTGYQLLMDSTASSYGTVIPVTGPMTVSGDANYMSFDYRIPVYADGTTTCEHVVRNDLMFMYVPEGVYDIVITNPVPNDKIWIVDQNGRYDDMQIEAGYRYIFTVEAIRTGDLTTGDAIDLSSEYVGTSSDVPTPTPQPPVTQGPPITTAPPATQTPPPITQEPSTPPPTTVAPTIEPTPEPDYNLGDVNMDGLVNTGDAAMILRYSVELVELSPLQLQLAEVNGDGVVNTGDAAALLHYTIGLFDLPSNH